MIYIKKFASKAEFDAYKASSDYCEPHVSKIASEMCINSYNDKVWRWAHMPLTFEILDAVPNDSNIDTTSGNSYYTALGTPDSEGGMVLFTELDLWYSLNGGPWTQYAAEYIAAHPSGGYYWYQGIPVKTGDIIQFKGDNPTPSGNTYNVFCYGNEMHFGTRHVNRLKIYGNVASIIDSTNYASITEYDAGTPDYFTNKGYVDGSYYFFDCGEYNNPDSCDCTHLIYPKNPWLSTPLTVEVNANTTFTITDGEGVYTTPSYIYYKVNSGQWQQYSSGGVNLSSGDIIQFKGDMTPQEFGDVCFNFSNDPIDDIRGNPMSIIDSTNYATLTDFKNGDSDYYFLDDILWRNNITRLLSCHYLYNMWPHLMLPFDFDSDLIQYPEK